MSGKCRPLDIEGRRVLQNHVVLQGGVQKFEVKERRVLEHPETPLIGVRNEGNGVVFQNGRPGGTFGFRENIGRRLPRRNKFPILAELGVKRFRPQKIPAVQGFPAEGAIHFSAAIKNAAGLIPKRARLQSQGKHDNSLPSIADFFNLFLLSLE